MVVVDKFLDYIANVRRYSPRTVAIYESAINDFICFLEKDGEKINQKLLLDSLIHQIIRSYQVYMMEERGLSSVTINQQLSVLSSFSKFLLKEDYIKSNPIALIKRPKAPKLLPVFYQKGVLDEYFEKTEYVVSQDAFETFVLGVEGKAISKKRAIELYDARLRRAIVSALYSLGLRRSELISLPIFSLDFSRKVVVISGKGDKMREIPMIGVFYKEISLYLQSVEVLIGRKRSLKEPVFVTSMGKPLYSNYVDRAVKKELSNVAGLTGKRSPHALRHSLATELLNEGAELSSIKEILGHSSLAATQVYTHNSISKLKHIYKTAHPRAKNGGKNGD